MLEMELDPEGFLEKVCVTSSGMNIYSQVPVFTAVAPKDFAGHFLSLPAHNQRTIVWALEARYEHGKLARDLPDEEPWLKEVLALIDASIPSWRPGRQHRLNALVANIRKSAWPAD
jgi:hypothetical protein